MRTVRPRFSHFRPCTNAYNSSDWYCEWRSANGNAYTRTNSRFKIWAGFPGQESGNSLVDILYGDVNPSGKLPFTIAKNETDYSARVIYDGTEIVQIPYSEGLFIDYRHFDAVSAPSRSGRNGHTRTHS